MRVVWFVIGTELRQTARDPHVVVFLLFPILFYPLLVWAVLQVMLVVEGQSTLWRVDVEGPPEVVDAVLERAVPVTGGEQALREGRADLVVRATADGEAWSVTVAYAGTRPRSRAALDEIGGQLRVLRARRIEEAGDRLGLGEWDRLPYRVQVEVESTSREVVDRIGAMLLALLVPVALVIAGLYPAVDLAVTEREKGTVETTLSSAAPRLAILGGRLATCVLLMLAGALGNALGMALTANHLAATVTGDATLLWRPHPALAFTGVPVVVASALLVAATYFLALVPARSFKEGEYAATFAMLVLTAPVFAAVPVIVADDPPGLLAFLPLASTPFALRDAALGAPDPAQVAVAIAGDLALVALFARITARVTGSEAFLFGGQLPGWLGRLRGDPP